MRIYCIYKSQVLLCPKCGKPYKPSQAEECDDFAQDKSSGTQSTIWRGKDERKFRPKANPKQLCFSRWLAQIDQGKIDILPSAKLIEIKDQVKEWLKEAPRDKIIIFTQFQPFQVMLGCTLQEMKIKFLYFSVSLNSFRVLRNQLEHVLGRYDFKAA
jgi:SNF2 family DNA or RNA helicase